MQASVERFGGLDVLINNAGSVRAGRLRISTLRRYSRRSK